MPHPLATLKTVLVGKPKDTASLAHERLSKKVGLAVFASDNLSSSAYATEEMLTVLVVGGSAALLWSIPITLAITTVLALIALSYRETIHAYPSGGGAYIVAHENLGRYPGLVAASALLIDYVLTVSVSISAGVDAVVSGAPGLDGYRVPIAVATIGVMTTLNLRGVKESGRLFAVPTYAFVVLLGGMIVWGFVRYLALGYRVPPPVPHEAMEPLTLFLLMRAFSHGSAAVTGIEAISNGVPAFREPEARNAATTLAAMAAILASLFIGITVLARLFHIEGPTEEPRRTVVALIARTVFGGGPLFFAVLGATALILFLAANTSYADFPRLSAVLARDRFAPRQLMNRGDRLAFSNGILALGILASLLVVLYQAEVSRLINLYVVGVFTSLTLSQAGMVRHWQQRRAEEPRWRRHMLINAAGGTATTVVLVIVVLTKFLEGAWMVVVAASVLVVTLESINRHYVAVGDSLRDPSRGPRRAGQNHVVLLVGTPDDAERLAFLYAERVRTLELHSVHFSERGDPKGLEARWAREIGLLPTSPALEIVEARAGVRRELRRYIEQLRARDDPSDFVTVLVCERMGGGLLPWLGSRKALVIKTALLFTPGVVVTDVPFVPGAGRSALERQATPRHVVIVLVSALHNATLHALEYARTLSADELQAVHVALDPEMAQRHVRAWREHDPGVPLQILDSPYRELAGRVRSHVREITADGATIVTLVIPEFVVRKWWHNFLHNQNALDLKWTFLREPDVVVTSVPYHLTVEPRGTAPAHPGRPSSP